LQVEEEEISFTMIMDPWSIFLYGIKAPITREKYKGRPILFPFTKIEYGKYLPMAATSILHKY
jgi:hypothetical protein